MALIRRKPQAVEPEPEPALPPPPGTRKTRRTPTRREAEAARRQRVSRVMTRKEARRYSSQQARTDRMKAISAREASPEKALMRDYIDARLNLGEFLLPAVVVILAVTVLGSYWPAVTAISTITMYVFILAVFMDSFLMWRGFKGVLATRMPSVSPKGLLMYGVTRSTQIRRFRMPAPRLKRGQAY